MSMKFERDERKFDFHDIGCEIKRKRETSGMTQDQLQSCALPTELRRTMAAAALFRFRIFASNLSLHSVNLRVNLVALSETTNIMINSHAVLQIEI